MLPPITSLNRNLNHTSLDNDLRKMRPPGFNEMTSVQTQSKLTLGDASLSDGTGVGHFTYGDPYTLNKADGDREKEKD